MSTSAFSPLLPFLLLLHHLVHLSTTAGTTAGNLIDRTCKQSSQGDANIDFNFCVTSLHSTRSSQYVNNLSRLGLISITLVKKNVSKTTNLIKNLLGDVHLDDKTKEGLKDCLDLYSDSISTISEVARDYRAKRFEDANVKVSSVMGSSNTCEDGFQQVGVVSPLSKQNKQAFQLGAIALSIINMQPH